MMKTKQGWLALAVVGAVLILTVGATIFAIKRQHIGDSLPIMPGAEKTREVLLHMTAADRERDEAYGSVYPSTQQAQEALKTNPQDARAHRTLARDFVNRMYGDDEYLATPETSPRFLVVKRHLLEPAVAEYEAALRAEPGNPVTQYNLAAAYSQTGQKAKAIALYQQVKVYPPLQETAEIALRSLQS